MIYTTPIKNYIQRNGFVMVSNLLLNYQHELDITDSELTFIIKIMKNKDGYLIHDNDLDSTVCPKTLSRRRNGLRAKGLLNFVVIKKQNPITGKFSTQGISYDLSSLEEKLQKISDKLEKLKQKKAEENISKREEIVETAEEDSPLEKYKNDFKEYYGVDYKLTEYEINHYNKLSDENKLCISYIFEYCQENGLFGKLVPKLSLFFKVDFRMADLKRYCVDNGYLEMLNYTVDKIYDEEFNQIVEKEVKRYYKRVSDNYPFFDGCREIMDKNRDKDIEEIRKMIDDYYEEVFGVNKKYGRR